MNNQNTNTNTNTNVLPQLKTPWILYPLIFIILFLIIFVFLTIYKVPLFSGASKSQQETEANVAILLFFSLIVVGLCFALLPNFKELRSLFEQIGNVTYVIIYTIALILFFRLVPSDIINKYAYIFTPVTAAIGAWLFYKGFTKEYMNKFSINYERIKLMILLFCLITIFTVYYNIDPGGYIQQYFGYSFLITIVLSVFAFLYLLIILTLPDDSVKSAKASNFLSNFSSLSIYGSMAFILFIIIITVLISTYPEGFFNDKSTSSAVIIILLIISILSVIVLGANLFSSSTTSSTSSSSSSNSFNTANLFKRSLLILFGIIISGLLIFWIVYNIQNLSGQSSIISFVLNLLLVIIVLGLIYKTINVQLPAGNSTKNAFFSMIFNTLFYIPCLFSGTFDSIGKFTTGNYNGADRGSLIMLLTSIILFGLYFVTPYIFNSVNLQGGKPLVNQPVYTNSQNVLGNYIQLNGNSKDTFDYQYAISCWIYIDAAPPNTSPSYNKYTSLLNFADKPNILYNGQLHTLQITIQQKDLDPVANKLIDFDENGNRILYINDKFLLQKWNNIIINYTGGVLDIFLNGELVKSDIGVVPYYTLDNLTVGENNGISGGICNVVYFSKALTSANMYYLYNMVKNNTPPVQNESNTTIIIDNTNMI